MQLCCSCSSSRNTQDCEKAGAKTNYWYTQYAHKQHFLIPLLDISHSAGGSPVGRLVHSLWVNIPVNWIPKEKDPERSVLSLKVPTVNPQWDFPPSAEVELQDISSEAEDLPHFACSSPLGHWLPPFTFTFIFLVPPPPTLLSLSLSA